jgi:DNA-binding MarR family transcriptional regulator
VILDQYRDLQLLHELTLNPHLTQRDLQKKTGVALGLINLQLHRLEARGLIRISNSAKERTRYLIMEQGIVERERLLAQYQEYSLQYYRDVRKFLKGRLLELASEGLSRILLLGSGEMAEVAYLTIQEVGLTLAGVVDEASERTTFLNLPIRPLADAAVLSCDRILVATLRDRKQILETLTRLGIPQETILLWPEQTGIAKQSTLPTHPLGRPTPAFVDVVILCGGRGTRLAPLTSRTPKPLLPVAGEPFLLHLLLRLKEEGFRRFMLAAHYLPEQFEAFVERHRDPFPGLRLVVEPKPLGTGGALRHAADHVESTHFLLLGSPWSRC